MTPDLATFADTALGALLPAILAVAAIFGSLVAYATLRR